LRAVQFEIIFNYRSGRATVDGKEGANDDHWREKPIEGVFGGIGGAIEAHGIDKCRERPEHPKGVLDFSALTIPRPFDTTHKL